MTKEIFKNKTAFTLIETLISLTIISIVMVASIRFFHVSMLFQAKAIASKDMQENIRYALEVISKEIRMARVDNDGTCVIQGDVYWVNSENDELYFLNQYNQCVHYFLEDGRLKIERGNKPAVFVTPASLNVSKLKFIVSGSVPFSQPQITILIKTNPVSSMVSGVNMSLQTTLSTRHYE